MPAPVLPQQVEPPRAPEPIAGVAFAPPAFAGWATPRNTLPSAPPPDAAAWHAAQAADQQRQQAAVLAQLALAAMQAQVQQWSPAAEAAVPCALPRRPDDVAPSCDGLPQAAWQQLQPAVLAYYRQVPAAPGLQLAFGDGGWRLVAAP